MRERDIFGGGGGGGGGLRAAMLNTSCTRECVGWGAKDDAESLATTRAPRARRHDVGQRVGVFSADGVAANMDAVTTTCMRG